MPTTSATDHLKVKERVVATADLPHIPEATAGRVLTRVGLTWIRYTVLFDNGVIKSTLDRSALARPKEWVELLRRRELGLDQPDAAVADAASPSGGGGGAAVEAGAVVNGVSVPVHLLDRSKSARTRLAG
jgi:hypothetical protein